MRGFRVPCVLRFRQEPAPGARVQFVQARMGVSTGWGGAGRLAETVGRREALRLLLHSPSLDAAAAVGAGLADAVGGEGEPAAEAAVRLLLEPALKLTRKRHVSGVEVRWELEEELGAAHQYARFLNGGTKSS
mmetsp:Transcript_31912/g.101674  ORF Transcript_31912/g.101674 Transcript_31912/m.101674 type:complete len:133 (+) Transcript_31912:74-472(+)